MSKERQTEVLVERRELRFPEDVPVMIEHLKKGWTIGGGDAVLILKGLLQMSMSDARLFAELTARVDSLETRLQELADRVEGKNLQEEVLGPVADHSGDRAARDGFRTLLEKGGVTVAADQNMPSGGAPEGAGGDPAGDAPSVAPDPGLRDRLAALQGAEAAAARPVGKK